MKLLTKDQVEIILDHVVFLAAMAEAATSRGVAAKDEVERIKSYATNTIAKLDDYSVFDINDLLPPKEIA